MTLLTRQQFIAKYNNKYLDFDGRYGPQCVDLARAFIKEVLGLKEPAGVEGAKDFYLNFEKDKLLTSQFIKIPNTPTFIPNPDDIVIFGGNYGPYGHIAIIDSANVNTFMAFSQNDPPKSIKNIKGTPCILKNYSYLNSKRQSIVLGFLRKK